jgi:hypothetical protein
MSAKKKIRRRKPLSRFTTEQIEKVVSFNSKAEDWAALAVVLGVILEMFSLEPFLVRILPFWSKDFPPLIIAVGILLEIRFSGRGRSASDLQKQRLEERADIALRRGMSRYLRREKFISSLDGKPKADISIAFKANDEECYFFASQIKWALEKAGWNVSEFRVIVESDSRIGTPDMPLAMRATDGMGGVAFAVKEIEDLVEFTSMDERRTPISALRWGFFDGGIMDAGKTMIKPNMRENLIEIFVAPRVQGF